MSAIAVVLVLASVSCGAAEPASTGCEVTENAVQVPVGKFFLLRQGDTYAAVKLTEPIRKGDGGYKYVWYSQRDGSGIFTNAAAKKGKGEVFEKYRVVKRMKGGRQVKDAGGVLHIVSGPLKVEWSQGNWVYFASPTGDVEIAVSHANDIAQVNYRGNELVWHHRNQATVSQPDASADASRFCPFLEWLFDCLEWLREEKVTATNGTADDDRNAICTKKKKR